MDADLFDRDDLDTNYLSCISSEGQTSDEESQEATFSSCQEELVNEMDKTSDSEANETDDPGELISLNL